METIVLARAINGANGGLIGMTSAVNGTTGISLGLRLGYGNGLVRLFLWFYFASQPDLLSNEKRGKIVGVFWVLLLTSIHLSLPLFEQWITWAAAGSLFLAVLPLSCACITGRSERRLKY